MSSNADSAPPFLTYASDSGDLEDGGHTTAASGDEDDGQQFKTPMMETRAMRARGRSHSISLPRGGSARSKSGSRTRGPAPYQKRVGKQPREAQTSVESLQWDGSGVSLLDATARSHLWSTSAHQDVPVDTPDGRSTSVEADAVTVILDETMTQRLAEALHPPLPGDVLEGADLDAGPRITLEDLGSGSTPPRSPQASGAVLELAACPPLQSTEVPSSVGGGGAAATSTSRGPTPLPRRVTSPVTFSDILDNPLLPLQHGLPSGLTPPVGCGGVQPQAEAVTKPVEAVMATVALPIATSTAPTIVTSTYVHTNSLPGVVRPRAAVLTSAMSAPASSRTSLVGWSQPGATSVGTTSRISPSSASYDHRADVSAHGDPRPPHLWGQPLLMREGSGPQWPKRPIPLPPKSASVTLGQPQAPWPGVSEQPNGSNAGGHSANGARPKGPANQHLSDDGARRQQSDGGGVRVETQQRDMRTIQTDRIARAMMVADSYVLPYKNRRVSPSKAADVSKAADTLLKVLIEGAPYVEEALQRKAAGYRRIIADVVAGLEEASFEQSCEDVRVTAEAMRGGGPRDASSPKRCDEGGRHEVANPALTFLRESVLFLLELISDDNLPDIEPGVELDMVTLKDLNDDKVPEVLRVIKELRDTTGKYATHTGCDSDLVSQSRTQCECAYKWTRQVVSRYRGAQLHLSGNTPARDGDFAQFDPFGEMSVYEFFSAFDDWAAGYLSDEAKAHLLYTKYLPVYLTESYEELRSKKKDYAAMKKWLIDQYGMITAVADGKIRAIRALKEPTSEDDLIGRAKYLREIHRTISKLYSLEIRKGVAVPDLQDYLEATTFLHQLLKVMPPDVQDEWCLHLAKLKVDISKVAGRAFLNKLLEILRDRYTALESRARLWTGESRDRVNQLDRRPIDLGDDSDGYSMVNHRPATAAAQQLAKPKRAGSQKQQPKGGKQNGQQSSGKKPSRWTCLIKDHDNHELAACAKFFESSPKLRRRLCRFQGCWTCLSRNGTGCKKGECSRMKEIPVLLLCQQCAEAAAPGQPVLNVLMCSIEDHAKPDPKIIGQALEKWIPKFKLTTLKGPVTLGFLNTHAVGKATPPVSRSSRPSSTGPSFSYDTGTGSMRRVAKDDVVVKPVREEAFYVMQTLNIGGENILAFYDSGSNTHLVEGEFAERVGFTVLSDKCVPIGVVGGGEIWSEYGQYSCILGPDTKGVFHELECQGLSRISSAFPEFNLRTLHPEAAQAFPPKETPCFPMRLGGDRVKLLIGIKSIGIAPRLHCTLPNGLGIYISALYDVYGSNICFGGAHHVFSLGYSLAGMSSSHVQVLFTQLAHAYMRAPYTGLMLDVDESGPLPKSKDWNRHNPHDESGWDWLEDRGPSASVAQTCPPCECSVSGLCSYTVSCNKAAIPLSKLKGLIDEDDIPAVTDFRCDRCINCPGCKISSRAKTRSLQESFEQEVIERSVTVSLDEAKVRVDLPFIKPPAEFLTQRHGGSDNYYQAIRVYRAQCNKPPEVRHQIIAAQEDLARKGFMVPLSSLPDVTQELIMKAPFRHYFPWRAVYKPGSVSTPVRLVVDPSCTGLNIILAKGENMLTRIPDVLTRLRTHRAAWTTDVSKLYNMLHLNDSSLPYSLFLFDSDLDPTAKPKVWVMVRAWYGVTSTGNQSGVGLQRLAELKQDQFPLAVEPLTEGRYVDDVASGADSSEVREEQIRQTVDCLAAGGFSVKFIAKSGLPPPEGSSNDGRTVGCLGISWDTKADSFSPAIDEMNLQRKVRGQKAAPERDVTHSEGLRSVFQDGLITKSRVLSRIAELYDPVGWWEPVRLQLKFLFQDLNEFDWNDPIPEAFHNEWVESFLFMETLRHLTIPRCVVPITADPNWKIRLICLADAAEGAGGTAIYGGVRLPDGQYSCSLLMAKSRLMKQSVPRNELEAIVIMAEAALTVTNALGDRVEEVRYFTDSTVAMCWVLNSKKRLRMFVHNRVQSIRHAIRQVQDGTEVIPLYHVDGTANLADLVTKPRKLSSLDLSAESPWQSGMEWMRRPTAELPSSQFVSPPDPEEEDLVVREMFQDVESHMLATWCRSALEDPDPVTDIPISAFSSSIAKGRVEWFYRNFDFVHLGWARAFSRLEAVCRANYLLQHRTHARAPCTTCVVCTGQLRDVSRRLALRTITLVASAEAEEVLGKSRLARSCEFRDGVWASGRRLQKEGLVECEDLDFSPFFDSVSIKKVLPVMAARTRLFYALLLEIHFRELPHAGVEATLARIMQSFYPIGDPRRVISMVKRSCSKCRLILKQVVGAELADIHSLRTTVAPPFYAVMMDIAMGFKAKPTKDHRKCFTANALVIVCLLTSATSILVLDGLETQAVVSAMERHASRYGVPAHVFVDAGTQLEKLRDTEFSLRDMAGRIATGKRFTVTVATPKAHEQQGRVEAKIKIVRNMLQVLSDTTNEVNTLLGWETVFSRIADHIDNLPIARGSDRVPSDLGWEIITPNRLKLGRNNFRQLEGSVSLSGGPQSLLERNRLLQEKWYTLFVERIHLLVPSPSTMDRRSLEIGDVVLFLFQDAAIPKLETWRLGVIVRQVSRSTYEIRYSNKVGGKLRLIQRSARQISLIYGESEIPPTSVQFFEQ